MEKDKKANLTVNLEVSGKDIKNGVVMNTFEAEATIAKSDAGRDLRSEDTININATSCGNPTVEANYSSKATGTDGVNTDIALDIKGQTFDMNKKELIDAIASGSKLTKADAGREANQLTEDWLKLKVVKDCSTQCTDIESYYSTKTSDIVK